jgi:hypothetical protein
MDIENKLIHKLKGSPMALLDLTPSEYGIINSLINKGQVIKFIDNGSCNYPISTLHQDAYYIKLS